MTSPGDPRGRAFRGRSLVFAGLAALAAFAAVTWAALEGGEVVVLRTRDEAGGWLATRVWIADDEGGTWIEAANAERPFYRNLLRHPEVELVRGGETRRYRAEPAANPAGHHRIRRLLGEKYGSADRWIGLLADTSGSIAIRLVAPAPR